MPRGSIFNQMVLPLLLILTPLAEYYALKGIQRVMASYSALRKRSRPILLVYKVLSFAFLAFFFGFFFARMFGWVDAYPFFTLVFGTYVCVYSFKYILAVFVLAENLVRAIRRRMGSRRIHALALSASSQNHLSDDGKLSPIPDPNDLSRRAFLSQAGLAMGLVPAYFFSKGILDGRYIFRLHEHTVVSKHLPLPFDGLRILQLSDFHVGSFDSRDDVARGVRLAMAQRPDLICFTGDAVNQRSAELDEWAELFAELKAPMGTYSILGNHDYGRYFAGFDTVEAQMADTKRLVDLERQMGYTVLLDEHLWLEKGQSRIALIGVQNWGHRNPVKFGNLDKATQGLEDSAFKLLMSHDPSHWDYFAQPSPMRFDLTLSGHTHGMQMGVVLGDVEWSPIEWMYPHWAGMYKEGEEYLNVNRGFGYVLYPGRVGILPEITMVTLRRA